MQRNDFIDELERQGRALGSAAARARLDARVPTCQPWTVAELVAHVGKVHRWAISHVRDAGQAADGAGMQAPHDGVLDWYAEGHEALVRALREAPDDVDAWTFLPAPSPLEFWARRQAHETAIHRADADGAFGRVPTYDAGFAADGVAELIDGFFCRQGGTLVSEHPRTLLIRLTDTERNDRLWHLTIGPDGRQISHDDSAPAEATVTGPSSRVYLFLWNRISRDAVEVGGDLSVLDLWQREARIS